MTWTRTVLLAGSVVLAAACSNSDTATDASELVAVQGETAVPDSTTVAPTMTAPETTTTKEPEPEVTVPEDPPRRQELPMLDLTIPGSPEIPNTLVSLDARDDEVEVVITTKDLTPGHPMTAWIVPLKVEECKEAFPAIQPCQPFMLTALDRPDLGNIRYLGGGITADDGSITIAGKVTKDGLPSETPAGEIKWWYETEFESFRDVLFHVIIHDHGPPIEGIVDEMWQTFRGGCTVPSLGPGLPENALADGPGGPNTCINAQATAFEPDSHAGGATSNVPPALDVQVGTVRIEPATVPAPGEHELTLTGENFIPGTGIAVVPCIIPGEPLVFGEVTLPEANNRIGTINPLADCLLGAAIGVQVDVDGTFTLTETFDVSGAPDPSSPDGTNFVIGAGSADGAQTGGTWLPVVDEG